MNEENDKTKDMDEEVEVSTPLENAEADETDEDLKEETDEELETDSEAIPAPEGLHALDFTPSESSTTNIPPRLPEGFSYKPTQPTDTRKKPKKIKQKTVDPATTNDTGMPLRSEPNTARNHRKYRKHHRPNKMMLKAQMAWNRYKWWLCLAVVVIAAGATYPFWGERLAVLMQSKEEVPVVAADTILPVKDTLAVDSLDTIPQLTHEDSLRIQDSVRHARWMYYQRKRKQQEAAKAQEEQNSETAQDPNAATTTNATSTAPTTSKPTTVTHTTHGDSVH